MLSVINQQFIEAARCNHLDLLKNLLDQGANIHANDDEPLRWATRYGHFEVVKFLVSQGANIHADNDTALRWSASKGQLEVVKFLVTQGADIHANDDEIFKTAIKNKNEPILMLLNAFLTEEKLLVAAVGSMSVLPAVASVALVAASDSTSASSWVCGMPQTPHLKLKKLRRAKI